MRKLYSPPNTEIAFSTVVAVLLDSRFKISPRTPSHAFCMLRWLLVDLDLDNYVAEPFSIYATGESGECLFSPRGGGGGGGGLPEAIHCLCIHNTFFKMVPINDNFWK